MSELKPRRPRLESVAVFATVLRSWTLLRTQVAYLLFAVVELGTWVAILVYAYDQGGATASGLVAFAQLAPAVLFAPLAATLGDRVARTRVLAIAYAVYAAANLLVTVLLATGQPPLAVYAGAVITGLALTLVRPAHASVMPQIARTPSELTAANVASGTMENLGIVVGSIGGGILLGIIGVGGVYLVCTVAAFTGFILVARLRVVADPVHHAVPVATTTDAHGTGDHLDHRHGDDAADAAAPSGGEVEHGAGLASEMAAGLRAGLGDRLIRPLVLMVGASFLLQGAADVLMVVLALDIAGMGESGVGLLSGATGIGGLAGAALAIGLVGRRRLVGALLLAAVVAGAGMALPGVVPVPVLAIVGFLVLGSGRSVIDVVGRTLLQRVTPDRYLTRIFGVVEGTALAGLALGTLLAPFLVETAGPEAALVITGALLPVGALVMRRSLLASEAAGAVHERELGTVRSIGMFTLLPLPILERLAANAGHLHAAPGDLVIAEGQPGDTYYMIERGTCVVARDGVELNRLGPGDGFGEIALLHDVPRTASITAVTDMDLFTLDRTPFLEALTGQSAAYALARQVADERLARP